MRKGRSSESPREIFGGGICDVEGREGVGEEVRAITLRKWQEMDCGWTEVRD